MGNGLKFRRKNTASSRSKAASSVSDRFGIPTYKVVVLGCSDSGKTTLLNRWSSTKFQETALDVELNRQKVFNTIKDQFVNLLDIVLHQSNQATLSQEFKKSADEVIAELEPCEELPLKSTMAVKIRTLWESKEAQEIWRNREKFQLADSLEHFCSNIEKFAQDDYISTLRDNLQVRTRTLGIYTTEYTFPGSHHMEVVDVGGERSERKKWPLIFPHTNLIVFTASCTDFDRTLFEAPDVNRLTESIAVFKSLVENPVLKKTVFYLTFTKIDLLKRKLASLREKGLNLEDVMPPEVEISEKGLEDSELDEEKYVLNCLKEAYAKVIPSHVEVDFFFVNALEGETYVQFHRKLTSRLGIKVYERANT